MSGIPPHNQPEHPEDLLELYVLDLLDEPDVAAVERFLERSEAGRERVRELRGITAMLSADVEPIDPPPALRQRIIDAVHGERAESTSRESGDAGTDRSDNSPISLSRARQQRSAPYLPWAVAAVLALALIGSMLWNVSLRRDLDESDRAVAHAVRASGVAEGVTGRVLVIDDDGTAWIALSGMPVPEPGQVFQVWLIADGDPVPNVTFLPNTLGYASVAVPADVENYRLLAITIEPEGGSPVPTTEPIILSDLSQPLDS